MRYTYTGSKAMRLVWGLFMVGSVTGIGTTLALGLAGIAPQGLNVPVGTEDQLASGLGLVLLLVLFGTPFFTAHELRPRHLVVRQGVLAREFIPYDEIQTVERTERTPIGLGVRWAPGEIFVVTWPTNLVAIRLRRRRRFRLLGLIPIPGVRTIVVNVDRPDDLVYALRERIATREERLVAAANDARG